MNKNISRFYTLLLLIGVVSMTSCKKDFGNLNNPTVEDFLKNASKDQLNNLVSGTESAMRNNLGLYLDDVSVIGREIYRFSGADPRYTTDLLGASDAQLNNTGFYIVNTWSAKYRVVKNCNLLIQAANNSTFITENEKKAYIGFAKTVKAYQLLLVLNLTGSNGVKIDVDDPAHPAPTVGSDESLTAIAALLDEAKADLGGAEVSFPLSSGFRSFNDAAGLIKFNRAIAARVSVYRQKWDEALTNLSESFFDLQGPFELGVYHVFGTGSGDQLNSAFSLQNQAGEVRLAHPDFGTGLDADDDRQDKATERNSPYTNTDLTSDKDVWVYTSSTAPVPIIRNEELILIYAEAKIQGGVFPDAVTALNTIRTTHNAPVYAGAVNKEALITEMLNQRRYSLYFEGHRWVDLRRYDLLTSLPVDRPEDDVWTAFPLPSTEE